MSTKRAFSTEYGVQCHSTKIYPYHSMYVSYGVQSTEYANTDTLRIRDYGHVNTLIQLGAPDVASHVLTVPSSTQTAHCDLPALYKFVSLYQTLNYLFLRIFSSSNPGQVSIRFFRHYYSYFFVPIDLFLFVAFWFRFAVTSLLYPLAHSPCAAVSIESMSGELAALETEIKEYRLQVGILLLQPSQGTVQIWQEVMLTPTLSLARDSAVRSPSRSGEFGAAESQN